MLLPLVLQMMTVLLLLGGFRLFVVVSFFPPRQPTTANLAGDILTFACIKSVIVSSQVSTLR